MNEIIYLDHRYLSNTYKKLPVTIVRGKGSILYDLDEKPYIDLTSGIGVNTFGICDDLWLDAVKHQLDRMQHCSNRIYAAPCAELAEKLCEKTRMCKVFFSNSGAEANECAVKAARKYSAEKKGCEYNTVISLDNSFHGRTISMLSATGQEQYHQHYKPLTPGFISIPANVQSLGNVLKTTKTAAIMIECIQGEGGVVPLDAAFIQKAHELCNEYDIPLIVDEVQTGNGRTGKLYSYMHFGIQPDIVTTAKGLSGGLPLGATLFGDKMQNIFEPGDHGSTFGGNPVCCAGAISILDRITENLMQKVHEKGKWIHDQLQFASGIEKVEGMGLMIGVSTKKDPELIVSECLERGVICMTAKRRIRLLPSLNITFELLKEAITILKTSCVNY